MRDLTPNEIGSLLFKIKGDLEVISCALSKCRSEGIGPSSMVPVAIIVSETKVKSIITNLEDVIQLIAKVSYNLPDKQRIDS